MLEHFAARATKTSIPITVLRSSAYKKWLNKQPKYVQTWLKGRDFKAKAGDWITVPSRDGKVARVVLGRSEPASAWDFANMPARLPKGRYFIEDELDVESATRAAIGWSLATYEFNRYRDSKKTFASLVWPERCDRAHVERTVTAIKLGRDLINTPAGDLGPEQLADAAKALAEEHGAKCTVIVGKKLLEQNYPAVHAVGRAAEQAPRLIDLRWGEAGHPKVTLVGKGVCFDSGGLDLKTPAGMKLMKKDMGGSAAVLALAHMIMHAQLPVRLRVLVPAVENAVSGNAFRPLDVLSTRKGITVEVGNTDAEGRLILCDALAEACTESPDLLIDFATLTGAARVALGTELPALFCNDDELANVLLAAGERVEDPMWRLPLHRPYRRFLDSRVADINNIGSVPQGGAITAALFLQEFVDKGTKWAHVDTMGWYSSARPGRPIGGEVFGIQAFYEVLLQRYAPTEEELEAELEAEAEAEVEA